ncbi:hypothetical protein R0135_02990 [Congregibacter variabilis]|uniref:Uncharacterized protein n=1 Tax=Congregibacter variabilis TaxID=3081200 RepID=A0ABZ0I6E6_9GAMM|nr:hypothetical protein R0135_02990 [Congregibacter sp. IMCC43200]
MMTVIITTVATASAVLFDFSGPLAAMALIPFCIWLVSDWYLANNAARF